LNNNRVLSQEVARFTSQRKQKQEEGASRARPGAWKPGEIKPGSYSEEWLEGVLAEAAVPVYYTKLDRGTTEFYVPCPNEAAHTSPTNRGDSYVKIYNGHGKFHCWHSHCQDIKFSDFARAWGIEYRARAKQSASTDNNYLPEFFEWRETKEGSRRATKVIDIQVCNWICENYQFFIMGDLPYLLNDTGCYVLDEGGAKLKRIIQSCIMPHLCKDAVISGIYRMILYQDKRKNYEELNQYPVEYVPFLNGFYDPIENKMIPISPEHYLLNQIPHEFTPGKLFPSPTFNELLLHQLPGDTERELWLEYCGTCFNRDMSGQKWMIIRGDGGTGKSTQLNLLAECIGEDNISNETLQGLNERFNATNLFGKFVNLCADISSEDMKRVDVLKKITGEDKNGVKYERKGKDCFFFTPFCKLLFSANEIPLNRDEKSNAFYRRLLVTVMDKKPAKVDRRLSQKLKEEIPGVIYQYMEALRRFYRRGGSYPQSLISDSEVQRLRKSADSVIAFFDEMLVKDAEGQIERGELYKAYTDYCKQEERLYPVTRNRLFERFRDLGIPEKQNHGKRFFTGLCFHDEGFSEESEENIPFWNK